MQTILISGGTGLIGNALQKMLLQSGYRVRILSRKPKANGLTENFAWDPSRQWMDEKAFAGTDYLINLSGSSISKPWNAENRKEIVESRLSSIKTLKYYLKNSPHTIKKVISASASGFYGDRPGELLNENSSAGKGFLSTTTQQWENAWQDYSKALMIVRIGTVLSREGGALPVLASTVPFGLAPVPGGHQMLAWIHIEDLCRIFAEGLRNDSLTGIINAVAPNPITMKEMMRTLRLVLNKYSIPLPVPAFAPRLLMGERASLVLNSQHILPKKLTEIGFQFTYPDLTSALKSIYG